MIKSTPISVRKESSMHHTCMMATAQDSRMEKAGPLEILVFKVSNILAENLQMSVILLEKEMPLTKKHVLTFPHRNLYTK